MPRSKQLHVQQECIHLPDQGLLKNNKKGMLYLNLREFEAKAVLSFAPETALSFVQTMQGNMEGFTNPEIKEAQRAPEAQAMLGHPTNRKYVAA